MDTARAVLIEFNSDILFWLLSTTHASWKWIRLCFWASARNRFEHPQAHKQRLSICVFGFLAPDYATSRIPGCQQKQPDAKSRQKDANPAFRSWSFSPINVFSQHTDQPFTPAGHSHTEEMSSAKKLLYETKEVVKRVEAGMGARSVDKRL